jgi:hypothetical protein
LPTAANGFVPAWEGQFPSLGYQVIDHIEDYLGIELMREQAERLIRLYRLDLDGRRVIRRAALRRPKGAGKSPEGGYTGFAELTGPVVFAGWDKDGQPIGKQHEAPWVQFAAVSEDQTDNVLVWLYDTLSPRVDVQKELGLDMGRTRIYLKGHRGRIEPVTAAAGSREGQPLTFGVLDQTEAWKRENGGHRLAAVMRRNAAKTGGWTYELQNAPEPGDGSVADQTARAWERGQAGVFFDTRVPESMPVLTNRPALLKALGEVYGEAAERGFVNLERLADECTDTDTDPADAYRFYLNIERPSEERAFDTERWDSLAKPDVVVADRSLVVAGFDGARFFDSTALIATEVETGHQFVIDIWERPENADESWEIPEQEVDAAVDLLFERFECWRLYGDPPYWESALDRWAGKYGEDRVVRWWTNRNKQMAYALRAYTTAIRASELSHDGDSRLTRHIKNARKRVHPQLRDDQGRSMWTIRKEGPNSPLKIDAAMAGCLSWEARGDAIAAGATRKVKRTVYGF